MFFDLVKDKNKYIFYRKEIDKKTKTATLIEKQFFDQEWNIKEKIEYKGDKINFHKMFIYNNKSEVIEIKDLLNSRSETYKYDDLGNLIFVDNNYLLMHKKFDKRNNWIMDFKIYKDTGLLKEVSVRELTYKVY